MTLPATIIVPCYNEGSRLNVQQFLSYCSTNENISFLFVDDGSTDNTLQLFQQLEQSASGRIQYIVLPKNSGKAEAVRQGVLTVLDSEVSLVGYWDADLATPLAEINRFIDKISESQNVEMIFGSRFRHLDAKIERRLVRHLSGRFVAILVFKVLNLPIYDTQCGAKLFRRSLAETLFAKPFSSTWLFDVELFARVIESQGRDSVSQLLREIPLREWNDVGKSKVKASYFPRIPYELLKIRLRYDI